MAVQSHNVAADAEFTQFIYTVSVVPIQVTHRLYQLELLIVMVARAFENSIPLDSFHPYNFGVQSVLTYNIVNPVVPQSVVYIIYLYHHILASEVGLNQQLIENAHGAHNAELFVINEVVQLSTTLTAL